MRTDREWMDMNAAGHTTVCSDCARSNSGRCVVHSAYSVSQSCPVTNTNGCPYCGDIYRHHIGRCPRVQAIEYYSNGTIKRIEFRP